MLTKIEFLSVIIHMISLTMINSVVQENIIILLLVEFYY